MTKRGETARGLVVGVHGRHYMVEVDDGPVVHCYPRGKKSSLACGDRVILDRTAPDQGVIASVEPRASLIYRSDQYREKVIAANVTQVVVVVAARPAFDEDLLMRCLVAAEQQQLGIVIVLNKADLVEETTETLGKLRIYASLGYSVILLSAKQDIDPLRPKLQKQLSVLVGQSGMGKSTIVNALVPDAQAATGEFSEALDSGKHTTTSARLYHLDAHSHIIDSPGMQTFGLHHLSSDDLAEGFREFRQLLGHCRFGDCRHLVEPGCAILEAVAKGNVARHRWEAYRKLRGEFDRARPDWG
ncbi:MAG: ribosome small subunit-dependent GTPase A [Burkholderiales bacterium]